MFPSRLTPRRIWGEEASVSETETSDQDDEPSLEADTNYAEPGDVVNLTGSGFNPGEDVELIFASTSLETATADDSGEITVELTIPENLDAGEHTLTATGVDSEFQVSLTLTVFVPDEGDGNWWDDLPQRDDLEVHPQEAPEGSNPHVTTERTPLINADGDRVGYLGEGRFLAIMASDADWPSAQIATADGEEIWVEDYDQYLAIISFDLILDQEEYQPGDEVTATGEHWVSGEDVVFALEGQSVGSFPADEDGEATAAFTLAEDIEPGEYLLTGEGADSDRGGSAILTVVEADDGGSTAPADESGAEDSAAGELAETGMTSRDLGIVAGLLLVVGSVPTALGFKNRRSRRSA